MRALLIIGVTGLAACGGLDNRPLLTGAVAGRAVECDAEGFVGLVGDASLRVPFDSSCGFRIDSIEPGLRELFVAPTAKKVKLVALEVRATELAQAGDVVGRPGAFARLQVKGPMGVELDGEVTAPDLPLSASAVGRSGMTRIGPFPGGCYRLEVSMKLLGKKALMSCLSEGEEQQLDVDFGG